MECIPTFDCHSHILPGLDDGAKNLEESLYLCRWLSSHGYHEVVCTSHSSFLYRNAAATVEEAVRKLQHELDKQGIPLSLHPSLEYRLIPETWPPERLLPWMGNHILIELPLKSPEKMRPIIPADEIKRLVSDGFQPVLAHPERYLWASQDDYACWHDAGAVFQRNFGSIQGFYGGAVQERARDLMAQGLYTFLGTDLHNREYTAFFDAILS